MRFTVEQRFAAAPEPVARALADPALYASLPDGPKLARPEVLVHEVRGDLVELQVRYRFQGELSGPARAVLDPDRLTWVEHRTHDLSTLSSTFVLRPDHYADRFRCEGTTRIEPSGGGARLHGSGELKVRAPLVGGLVERTLVADLQAHLSDSASAVEAFVRAAGDP